MKLLKKYRIVIFLTYIMSVVVCIAYLLQTTVTVSVLDAEGSNISIYYAEDGESFTEDKHSEIQMVEGDTYATLDFDLFTIEVESLRLDFSENDMVLIEGIEITKLGRTVYQISAQKLSEMDLTFNGVAIEYGETGLLVTCTGTDPYIAIEGILILNQTLKLLLICYVVLFVSITILWLIIVKNSKSEKVIIAFMAVLILPSLISAIFGFETSEYLENASSVEKPEITLSTIFTFTDDYESYFDDILPFKEMFVQLNGYLDYYVFDKSAVDKVIKGDENFLFYTNTVADYEGTNYFEDEELENILDYFLTIQEELEKQGTEFYIMIAPNKNTIYYGYMPEEYNMSLDSRANLLVEYLEENSDLIIVYPADEMESYKDEDLYYKWDTHWNSKGGYLAFTILADVMGIEGVTSFEEMVFTSTERTTGDLQTMLQIELFGTDIGYDYIYMPEITCLNIDTTAKYLRYTSDIDNNEKLLVFRDSFATSLVLPLSKSYQESVFVWTDFDWDVIEEEQPDVVIYEVVERNIHKFLQ